MSKLQVEFELEMPFGDCFKACRQAAAALNWIVTEQSEAEGHLVCEQVTSWTQPAQVELSLRGSSSGPPPTRVVMEDYMVGFGPLVSRLLNGEMGKFRSKLESIEIESSETSVQAAGTLAFEIERLAELRAQGVLTDQEFEQAKARLLGG